MSESLAQKADVAGVDLVLSQLRQEVVDVGVAVGRKAESARVEEVSQGGSLIGGSLHTAAAACVWLRTMRTSGWQRAGKRGAHV